MAKATSTEAASSGTFTARRCPERISPSQTVYQDPEGPERYIVYVSLPSREALTKG